MRVDLFDFELPEERIALRPKRPRDAARLLVVEPGGGLADRFVRDLPGLLRAGDALVLNDTRVLAAELHGERVRDGVAATVSVTLIAREGQSRWRALARGARKLAVADRVRFGAQNDNACLIAGLDATVAEKGESGEVVLTFDLAGPALDEAIAAIGHVPLPPYIAGKRREDAEDRRDYQTVYAVREGAVAAPTAGLHFTPEILGRIKDRGVETAEVTLHVGLGTFQPVRTERVEEHKLHSEAYSISAEAAEKINRARSESRRIVAVGTTTVRTLEYAAQQGAGEIRVASGEANLFIYPGYKFQVVQALLTNFHLPQSTLLMLVCALGGKDNVLRAYEHAVSQRYRFYSYGDCMFVE